jgi:tripartite-type tricarboxylate transporter receptor subunit TctC
MFHICAAFVAALIALSVPPATAADKYPTRPIRLIIPFSPGGGTDVLARAMSDKLADAFGASVVIDTRPGAGGTLGSGLVAKADPDGYTLLMTSASHTFIPGIYGKELTYDGVKDFRPITMLASAPSLLVIHPSVPANNLKQLIALARQRPGEISYASAGRGSNLHLTTELFLYMAKIKMLNVPYKGGGPALIATMSGEAHVNFPAIHSALPFVKQGRLRALAVTTKKRAPALPEVPSMHEAGVPGYDKAGWYGLFAPAATPEPIVSHVYMSMAKVLKDPDILKRLATEGAVPVVNPPAEFDAFVRDEVATWTKLIREMNL